MTARRAFGWLFLLLITLALVTTACRRPEDDATRARAAHPLSGEPTPFGRTVTAADEDLPEACSAFGYCASRPYRVDGFEPGKAVASPSGRLTATLAVEVRIADGHRYPLFRWRIESLGGEPRIEETSGEFAGWFRLHAAWEEGDVLTIRSGDVGTVRYGIRDGEWQRL